MHWIRKYVSKPWVKGARGPDAYDCFGLFLDAYRTVKGIELPDLAEMSLVAERRLIGYSKGNDAWNRIDEPSEELDAVLLGRGTVAHHIGLWTQADGGLVIHCASGSGVLAQTLDQIRNGGYKIIEFYRYADNPTR